MIRVNFYQQIASYALLYVQEKAAEDRKSAVEQAYKLYKDKMEKVIAVPHIAILVKRKKNSFLLWKSEMVIISYLFYGYLFTFSIYQRFETWNFESLEDLKKHHKDTMDHSLTKFKSSLRLKVAKQDKVSLKGLKNKIDDKFLFYENKAHVSTF